MESIIQVPDFLRLVKVIHGEAGISDESVHILCCRVTRFIYTDWVIPFLV